jgi:hypothetical protein
MKRWLAAAAVAALLLMVVAGVALAQSTAPATDACPCGQTPDAGGDGMRGGMMGGGRGMPEWAGMDDAVTELLGITQEALQAERAAGKSLAQIAAARGVSEAALIQAILDEHKADLAGLVADGKLTQAQADAMLARMQEQVKAMVNRTGVGSMWSQGQGQTTPPAGMPGRGGMRGGMRGGQGGTLMPRWGAQG